MTRSFYIALCAALFLTVAYGAAATNNLATAAFTTSPPGKVFDGTASTGVDKDTWGTVTNAIFGPGTTNTTVYAYGVVYASGSITSVRSRTLNATMLANGTADTTLASKQGDDAVYSTAIANLAGAPKAAVGPGTLGLAYAATDNGCGKVYVAIFTGGSASPSIKEVSGFTCSHCTDSTAGTGVSYVNAVTGIFYENSTYYVTWTTKKFSEVAIASTTGCSTGSTYPSTAAPVASNSPEINQQNFAYVQGMSTSGTAKWTAPAALVTGPAGTGGTAPTIVDPAAYAPSCASGNQTNSTNLICTVKTGAAPNVIQYVPVPTATGTPGTAVTVATNVDQPGTRTYPETVTVYTVAGVVYSLYQQGVLLNKADTITASSGATATYANTLTFYNLTSGATATAGGVTLNVTNTYQYGQYGALGLTYGTGWGLVNSYSTAATTYTSDLQAWFANGTTNGSKVTYYSGQGSTSSVFVDTNTALWAGAYSTSGASPDTVTTGYLGRLVDSTYTSSTFGNILVSFFGLISLVVAALFVF